MFLCFLYFNVFCVTDFLQKKSSILKKTKSTTKKLISSVTDTKWIGSAMNWVKLSERKHDLEKDASSYEEAVKRYKYHPYYASLDTENTNAKAYGVK